MTIVQIKSITKTYKKTTILKEVIATVDEGEFYSFLGPSGSGKTTLFNIVAGLEEPTSGHVYFDLTNVTFRPPHKRDLAYCMSDYALYPHMKVYENLGFPLKLKNFREKEIRDKVWEMASLLDLVGVLECYPKDLNVFQQQKMALGRGLIRRTPVWLLDEPLSKLDAAHRRQMLSELRKLYAQFQPTTLYATNDPVEALTLSDRIAVIRQGKIEQEGTPEEIYHHPANRFVGELTGDPPMNFIPAMVKADPELGVELGEQTLKLSGEEAVRLANKESGAAVLVGIRPESIAIQTEQDSTAMLAAVDLVESLGAETLITFSFPADRKNKIRAKLPKFLSVKEREYVWVRFDEKAVQLFQPGSGERL